MRDAEHLTRREGIRTEDGLPLADRLHAQVSPAADRPSRVMTFVVAFAYALAMWFLAAIAVTVVLAPVYSFQSLGAVDVGNMLSRIAVSLLLLVIIGSVSLAMLPFGWVTVAVSCVYAVTKSRFWLVALALLGGFEGLLLQNMFDGLMGI